VDKLGASDIEYVVWCGKLRGFGCRVRPSGHKSFIALYRLGGRNTPSRKVTIGSADKLTVDQAREAAARILARAELGEDEASLRTSARAEMTLSQLCDEYMSLGVDHKKLSTIVSDRSRINAHIQPLLGHKPIGLITTADISQFLQDVANGKARRNVKTRKRGRSIVRGGKGAASRTVRLLSGIFSYATQRGYLKENPCRGVRLYKDKRNERFLNDQEFRRLGDALRLAETEGLPRTAHIEQDQNSQPSEDGSRDLFSPHVIAAFRLLILTGCRLGEVLNLRWRDVDFERGVLNLSDSKTGQKKVLLSSSAIEILTKLERSGDYVVAGKRLDRPRADLQRPWRRITQYARLGRLRLHDLRHSYAAIGAMSGLGLVALGKLLGHSSPSTTQRYAHFGDDPLRLASEQVAEVIATAIGVRDSGHTDEKSTPKRSLGAADRS
jgi:integrase